MAPVVEQLGSAAASSLSSLEVAWSVLVPEFVMWEWLIALVVGNFLLFWVCDKISHSITLPFPDWESWNKRTFAFFMWGCPTCAWWTVLGYLIYIDEHSNSDEFQSNWENRVYQEVAGARLIGHLHVSFQFSQLLVIYFFRPKGQDSADMIAHHVAAMIVAWCSLQPYMHFWGARFGGLAELSSWWLQFMQFFNSFPSMIKAYPNLYQAFRVNFAIWFIVFRLGFWQVWQYGLYQDLFSDADRYGISLAWVINFTCWTTLWVLQLFWGKKVVVGICKLIVKAVTDTPLTDSSLKVGPRGEYIDEVKYEDRQDLQDAADAKKLN